MSKVSYSVEIGLSDPAAMPAILDRALAEYSELIVSAINKVHPFDMPIFVAAMELSAASLRKTLNDQDCIIADSVKNGSIAILAKKKK